MPGFPDKIAKSPNIQHCECIQWYKRETKFSVLWIYINTLIHGTNIPIFFLYDQCVSGLILKI